MLGILVFPRASPALLRGRLAAEATVVAVDAGAQVLHDHGLVPDLVVGDMDSVAPATLAALERSGARVERHAPRKRDSDAMLALRRLLGTHDDILFLGPGGGRADHALANLHLLAFAADHARVEAVDDDARTWVATPTRPLRLELEPGSLASMIPFDTRVEGITYEGFEYPLQDATMEAGDPYGLSNVALAAPQLVRVTRGRLLVVAPR